MKYVHLTRKKVFTHLCQKFFATITSPSHQ